MNTVTVIPTFDKIKQPNLSPLVIYLSSEDVAERLEKARISRNQALASNEQVRFWEERKQMDMAVIQQLTIPCDVSDITQENWETEIDVMIKRILKG